MVKQRVKAITEETVSKGFCERCSTPRKITASTTFGTCRERLSPFGGLLGLIKFLDLLKVEEVFDQVYRGPSREPNLGHYRMVVGILMLLFIGFNRLWHFVYIRLDAMVCGFFQLVRLPAACTFWRYVDSLGISRAAGWGTIPEVVGKRPTVPCCVLLTRRGNIFLGNSERGTFWTGWNRGPSSPASRTICRGVSKRFSCERTQSSSPGKV